MSSRKPSDVLTSTKVFPYGKTWEDFDSEWVTLEALAEYAEEYERFLDLVEHFELEIPAPSKQAFETLVSRFALSPEISNQLIEHCWLIAGLALTPQRKQELRNGLVANRELLTGIALHSRELLDLLFKVTARVDALMEHVRAGDPDIKNRDGLSRMELMRSLRDLNLIAERITDDIASTTPGRKPEHLRDTAMKLVIIAAERAGLNDLTISRGTNANPQPHLKGQAGEFLRGFFALVAPNKNEASLAPAIERVRRKMKK